MKTKATRNTTQAAEQAIEVRFFARRCGLTTAETLKLMAEANTVKPLKMSKKKHRKGLLGSWPS